MSRIRLQKWGKGRTETNYTVTLDGVPLGRDGLFADPALAIFVGQEVAKVPHRIAKDGAMVFDEWTRKEARSKAAAALRDYEANQAERDKGIHFDREEAQALREFAEYCMRGWVGKHAGTLKMILAKVPR